MSTVLFWLLMVYLTAATILAVRRGPRMPARIAIVIALFLAAFPWLRSWLSTDGRGHFHPAGAIANLEWLLVCLALLPVHAVCLYVILTTGRNQPLK